MMKKKKRRTSKTSNSTVHKATQEKITTAPSVKEVFIERKSTDPRLVVTTLDLSTQAITMTIFPLHY